jgi:hypothetical protein
MRPRSCPSFRRPYPEPSWLGRHNCPVQKLRTVKGKDSRGKGGLAARTATDQSDDAAVLRTPQDCPLTEVLVQGNQNSSIPDSPRQDLFVSGIFSPPTGPDDVVAGFP